MLNNSTEIVVEHEFPNVGKIAGTGGCSGACGWSPMYPPGVPPGALYISPRETRSATIKASLATNSENYSRAPLRAGVRETVSKIYGRMHRGAVEGGGEGAR